MTAPDLDVSWPSMIGSALIYDTIKLFDDAALDLLLRQRIEYAARRIDEDAR